MPDLTLIVGGMTCAGCAHRVTEALEGAPGVASADVPGWESGRADVALDAAAPADPADLVSAVEAAGYRAAVDGGAPPAPPANGPASGYGAPADEQPEPSGDGAPSSTPLLSDLPTDAYDLVVVGGGSAAFAAALKTSELGGRAAIVNDVAGGLPIGGTCVNVGCVPSKATIRAAEAVHRARRSAFDGVETSGRVVDFGAVLTQVRALASELREAKYVDVAGADAAVTLVAGRARLAGRTDGLHAVEVDGGARTLRARAVLVATGARTFVPDVPGLADSGYLTNETVWDLTEAPDRLVVLGGGYVAVETAQAFARLGVPVTLLQRSPRILPREDAALTDALTGHLEADGVNVRTGVSLRSAHHDGGETIVAFEADGEAQEIRGSHVLLATGRRGNTADLGLEALGVTPDARGFLPVDATLRTAADGVFGAGDVLGDKMFVYTAAYEGALAARNARDGLWAETDYTALPWVVFTDPQLAGVGLDLAEAEAVGIDAEATTLPMEHVPRAIAARDTRGSITLVRDRESDRLVGARVLAPEGSELLMEVALAIRHRITTEQLAGAFHPYLTLSEAVKLAALTFRKDVGQLSCCAA
ncbi:mercury(II) reductase [Rubrivirga sp. S365]|uniref:mercury(II) reductase n=1 Tax=Rubrivirga sp. S365 TaxID=3076080 RepID=UPI0028C79585|nr:mercury(II) reductase [Rubrivirga sp. S365]MDT7858094.1 mercury(II) reductase [Rubrivirga sp. S365]